VVRTIALYKTDRWALDYTLKNFAGTPGKSLITSIDGSRTWTITGKCSAFVQAQDFNGVIETINNTSSATTRTNKSPRSHPLHFCRETSKNEATTACILTGSRNGTVARSDLLERQFLSLPGPGSHGFRGRRSGRSASGPSAASRALARMGASPGCWSRSLPASGGSGSVLVVPAAAVFDWKGAQALTAEKKTKVEYLDLRGNHGLSLLPVAAANTLVRDLLAGKPGSPRRGKGVPFPGWGMVADALRNRRLARRELLVSMRKPTDGFVSRHLNRYVSLFLTRFFLMIRLSPNTISFGNLGLGIFGALLVALVIRQHLPPHHIPVHFDRGRL
jgi:hypothetical protein